MEGKLASGNDTIVPSVWLCEIFSIPSRVPTVSIGYNL